MREGLLMVAGLLDPFACLGLSLAHFILWLTAYHWIKDRSQSPIIAWLAGLGFTTLTLAVGLGVCYLLEISIIQDPVVMLYFR